ncbi:hypothetical protein ACFST9_19430 [Hymenobacter monticola]|uniref:Gliding motility-associated protein GldM C-terminal domain-containing protein n=1 Tax=Hymenobacter monticola TaxID=1705399 RepID=A0ABY4AYK0_9BACT|nr:hypothetical protein [Hymenobacter monticola]UOE31924.1 hypothetical protein MTP16_12335 [Hymenobacter monticola]
MNKLSYLFFSGMLLLCACKKEPKEEALPSLEGTYESTPTILAINPIVMYTVNGAINNQTVIEKFMRRNSVTPNPLLFSISNITDPNGVLYTLTISPDNKATIVSKHSFIINTTNYAIISRSSEVIHLLAIDSAAARRYDITSRCAMLNESIPAVRTPERCQPVAPGSFCKFRATTLISIVNGQLLAPQLGYYVKLQQSPNTYCSLGSGGLWNKFNSSIVNQLISGDTLLVQERAFAFRKK